MHMRKKILVVDNNPVILRLLSHALRKEDYEVDTAEDGLIAIELLERFKPDIVITDIIMPYISGDKLCRIIRRRPEFNNVFLIILSAIVAEENIDFRGLGADACIAKGPVKEMIKNVMTVFNHAARRDTARLSHHVFGIENVQPRQITKELLLCKKNFEITLQNMADGFLALTPSAMIVSVNAVAADFFRTPEERLVSTSFFDHFEAGQKKIIAASFKNITDSAVEIGEHDPVILHGRYLLLKMVPVLDEGLRSVIVLIDDITQRKIAELELEKYRMHLEDLVAQRAAELQEALSKVKQLSGFLPICASCKKIRDDKGYWNQIESYISQHSEAEFTHGICPDCVKKLYSDLEVYKSNRIKK